MFRSPEDRIPLSLYKIVLGPLLSIQGSRLRGSAIRLPEARGARSGCFGAGALAVQPLRLLFIGDSSAAGVGVEWQHEAMPQQAAERVSRSLNRPVSWELLAKSGIDTRQARALLESRPSGPADIIVSALGVNDVTSQRSPRQFVSDYEEMLRAATSASGARAAVVTGLPPMGKLPAVPQPLRWYLGQCASRLDKALRRLCLERDSTRYLSISWGRPADMASDGFHPGKAQYHEWAVRAARQIASLAAIPASLPTPPPGPSTARPPFESAP